MAIHMVVILTGIATEVRTITMAIPMGDILTIRDIIMGIRMKVQTRKS